MPASSADNTRVLPFGDGRAFFITVARGFAGGRARRVDFALDRAVRDYGYDVVLAHYSRVVAGSFGDRRIRIAAERRNHGLKSRLKLRRHGADGPGDHA